MTSINTGYEARIRQALGQPAAKPIAVGPGLSIGFPTVGLAGGFFSQIAPYLIYALMATFVIMLILVVIHYTVKPIFNFGENPDALINFKAPDWTQAWNDIKVSNIDLPSKGTLPMNNFSFTVDINVKDIKPVTTTGNVYVLLYKTAGVDITAAETGVTYTETVTSSNDAKFKAGLLTSFPFLEPSLVPGGTGSTIPANDNKPSLALIYDALSGKLMVYFITKTGGTAFSKLVDVPIKPDTLYRVGVVVSTTMVELYLNGQYANSNIYPGQTIQGTENDILVSTPNVFAEKVQVGNLFTTARTVSSGEMRVMGGPSAIKIDAPPSTATSTSTNKCPQ